MEGWTFSRFAGIAGLGSTMTASNPAPPAGAQVGLLQLDASMAQTSSLAPGSYTVSFQAAQRANDQYGTQTIDVRIDGASVGRCQPAGPAFLPCQTAPFALAAGDHTPERVGVGGGGVDYTALIDDLRVSAGP